MAFQEGFNPFGGIIRNNSKDGGSDSGGGVTLGNFARVSHNTTLPSNFSEAKAIQSRVTGYINIGDTEVCETSSNHSDSGIEEIADGTTIVFYAGDYYDELSYPSESGPVDACIAVATDFVDGTYVGELLPYDGIVYDADESVITIPIHDIPEEFGFIPIIHFRLDEGNPS